MTENLFDIDCHREDQNQTIKREGHIQKSLTHLNHYQITCIYALQKRMEIMNK